jgi:hypothetical protein
MGFMVSKSRDVGKKNVIGPHTTLEDILTLNKKRERLKE